jgi:hypothetical protein
MLPAAAKRFSEMRQLHAYWLARTPEDVLLPGRQHIDPVEMPKALLPFLALIDIEKRGPRRRYRIRLAGTAFRHWSPLEFTGRYIDELAEAGGYPEFSTMLDQVVTEPAVRYLSSASVLPSRDYVRLHRLGMPLARNGYDPDMILGIMLPGRAEEELTVCEADAAQ